MLPCPAFPALRPGLMLAGSLALSLVTPGCRGGSSTSSTSSSTPPTSAPPPATASATPSSAAGTSAAPAASASPASGAPATVVATRWMAGAPGGLTAPLTLLRAVPGDGAVLLDEATGDFLVGTASDQDGRVLVHLPGLELTAEPPAASKPGALRWPGGASLPLRTAPALPVRKPTAYRFVDATATGFAIEPLERPAAWYEGADRPRGTPGQPRTLVFRGRWLPATPSLPTPRASLLGGQTIRPEEQTPGRSFGCVVHGVMPSFGGAQATLVREAWQGWVRDRCAAAGAQAVVELSYSLVALAGVNLIGAPDLDSTPANQAFRGGIIEDNHRTPTSTTVLPINLMARVTTEAGSELIEEALLLDTRAGTCSRLGALVAPKGGASTIETSALEALLSQAGWVPRAERAAAVSLPGATLTVGPSSIDEVLPLRPYGIALASRHLVIGPRSTLVSAFVPSAATQRLTAALNVDF